MLGPVDFKDIYTVAARMKRMNKEYIGSKVFEADFATLIELIEMMKKQNEKNR